MLDLDWELDLVGELDPFAEGGIIIEVEILLKIKGPPHTLEKNLVIPSNSRDIF
jgi:hypothetical protein